MEPRITFITLGVADVARARAFYEALGFPIGMSQGDFVVFRAGGLALALFPRDSLACDAGVPAAGSGFSGVALAHNVRAKGDVADVLAEAEAAGGRVVKPAQDAPWGGHSGYFADPDGHLWEAAWNPHLALDAAGAPVWPD